jgi:hypothetical protein
MRILPDFTTYSTTAEVVSVSADGGAANCDKCGGSCVLTYRVTDEAGNGYNTCSLCVPRVGSFIRIPADS